MRAHSGEERLGPYCLHEQLGEGGMGVVYLASDADDHPVAIKVLRQGVPAEATARRRLAREVETMRRVHSPYVAEVLDADVEGSPPYIVTRYVAGRTLDDVVVSDGPMTGQALADLARGLAAALVAVHAAGVVHRDLKPANVMLVDGEPVVIDFGIAQAPDSTRLTMTGMFMGTPGYLAPEVIEGRPSGPAADIHSWGATMAYAATGRPPFGTGQFEAIFYRVVHGQPELDTMPAPLLPLVLSALARDPGRRPSAAEMAELAAGLEPAALVRAPAGAGRNAVQALAAAQPGQGGRTAADRPVEPALSSQLTASAPQAAWPGTRPLAVQPRDDFADLLTPVHYNQQAGPAPLGTGAFTSGPGQGVLPPPGMPGQVAPGQPWPAPVAPWTLSPGSVPGAAGQVRLTPGAGTESSPARLPLVMATIAALVAVSVLLPVVGAAVCLAVLILLRAADVTTRWLVKRRAAQGPRRSDPVSATAFYPLAVIRSGLTFVLLIPLALLCAAAAAALVVLSAGQSSLPKVGAYAVGALVACYGVGPGSKACRRPLSRFYGKITRSTAAAFLGSIALVALAAAAVAAAVTLAPGYWPADHLGNQLQTATAAHPVLHSLTANVAEVGRRLARWLGQRI